MRTVLVVDDEQRMLDLLALYLEPAGYRCLKAASGTTALNWLKTEQIDLVLLDVMMPEMDGWAVCKEIRRSSNVPVMMVTAREQEADVVKGLRLGADDYVIKPFREQELLARIEALLRRSSRQPVVAAGDLIWNEDEHRVSFGQTVIRLTPKEFHLLGLLMRHPGKVFEREQLIERIWGFNNDTEGRTVDSHVRNVREKIRDAGFPVDAYLQTVWGIGYKWVNADEAKK